MDSGSTGGGGGGGGGSRDGSIPEGGSVGVEGGAGEIGGGVETVDAGAAPTLFDVSSRLCRRILRLFCVLSC